MVRLLKKNPKVVVPVFLIFFFFSQTTRAASGSTEISWMLLIFGLIGGLALFLFGMELMSEGMKKTAGNQMRAILAALTRNRVIALLLGAFVTVVVQSSSATTVMLVSFVQAGLLTFVQSLGVILGADIGTTVTAQLIAFKLTDFALLILAVGFFIRILAKTDNVKYIGEAILGFGVLFFGMKLMSDAMKPLRALPEFIELVKELESPLLGLLVGAVFTSMIQSSAALIGIVIVLAQQSLITLDAGIPLVFGANNRYLRDRWTGKHWNPSRCQTGCVGACFIQNCRSWSVYFLDPDFRRICQSAGPAVRFGDCETDRQCPYDIQCQSGVDLSAVYRAVCQVDHENLAGGTGRPGY